MKKTQSVVLQTLGDTWRVKKNSMEVQQLKSGVSGRSLLECLHQTLQRWLSACRLTVNRDREFGEDRERGRHFGSMMGINRAGNSNTFMFGNFSPNECQSGGNVSLISEGAVANFLKNSVEVAQNFKYWPRSINRNMEVYGRGKSGSFNKTIY